MSADKWEKEYQAPVEATPVELEDGWESVLDALSAKDEATMTERMRCELLVRAELENGRGRGVPETAGVMIILHRIALAISNG